MKSALRNYRRPGHHGGRGGSQNPYGVAYEIEGPMMHHPPHPGTVLLDGWIAPLALTVTAAADALGVTRKTSRRS